MQNQKNGDLTYKQSMSINEASRYIKAVGLPVAVFLLSMFTISQYAAFGTKALAPMIAVCWVIGAICAIIVPSHRESVLKETMIFLGGYAAGLMALKLLLQVASGVSSQMIMASYDVALPAVTGNAIPGFLQTAILISAFMSPVGFIGMQVKRILSFKHNMSKKKFFDQTRSIRTNNQT